MFTSFKNIHLKVNNLRIPDTWIAKFYLIERVQTMQMMQESVKQWLKDYLKHWSNIDLMLNTELHSVESPN